METKRCFLLLWGIFLILSLSLFQISLFSSNPLTFEERLKAQEAIEKVYYDKRIWPKENPQPKPAFEKMVPLDVIKKKTEDAIFKSYALEKIWGKPITSEQLQAEMDRFVKKTKDPEGLKELFAALNNDPYLIAESLARQTLSDRLIRTWYAWDPRFHEDIKELADLIGKEPEKYIESNQQNISIIKTRFDLNTGKSLEERQEAFSLPGEDDLPEFEVPVEIRTELRAEKQPEPIVLTMQEEDFFILSRYEKESNETGIAYSIKVDKKPFVTWWEEKRKDFSLEKALAEIQKESSANYSLKRTEIDDPTSPDSWKPLDAPPSCRSRHTAIWTGNQMIIWGGYNGNYLDSGGIYTPITDSWELVPITSSSPSTRAYHTAIWTGEEMIIWGGFDGTNYLNDGACYDPSSNSWRKISSNPSINPRCRHTAVWTGAKMVIWGGDNGSSYFGDGWALNATDLSWNQINLTNAPASRTRHTACWTGEEMLIWGGYNGSYLSSGGRYSLKTNLWTSISETNVPTARADHTCVWAGSRMLVWGGYRGVSEQSGGIYIPSTNTWVPINLSGAPSARRNHTAVWTGTKMIIYGGGEITSYGTSYLSTGAFYDMETDSWTAIQSYSGRLLHTAIWSGNEMIVWGGTISNENYSINSGGKYSPTNNSWLPTSTGNGQPHYRMYNTAIWTGAEMIVWGGMYGYYVDNPNDLNSGSRYNPITDTWTPTSTGAGVPAIRCHHGAVWSGSEMWIWGGHHYYSTWYNNGSKYNPVDDTWITLPSTTLVGRLHHASHWTGTGMIVWGGASPSCTNTGGILDEATGIWKIMTTINAPSGRDLFGSALFSNKLIVWGGNQCDYTTLNTGGIYDIALDQWTATSTGANCPTARMMPGFVYTGNEIVVWAGSIYRTSQDIWIATNTGAIYYPNSNSWSPLEITSDTPTARTYFGSGVWTGYDAFFWGGYNYEINKFYGDAGRYSRGDLSVHYISPTNESPEPRRGHSTVWTGKSIIVWGGHPYSNGGGIFYPNTPPRAVGDIVNSYEGQPDTLALGSADQLLLVGSSSTNGANPESIPAYEDAFDSIVEFAWDLNGEAVLDENGELTSGAFDRFTANVTIAQEDLHYFGLDKPGDKTITFRVTDELGVKSWQVLTLHIIDINPPAASIVSPNGGETWPYSASEILRSQKLIVWTANDNLGLKRLRISYTTNPTPSESDWVCIADSLGTAGCDSIQLTDTTFLWNLPTLAEATAKGQVFPSTSARVKIEAWDNSDNLTVDTSDNTFYIIQPTTTAVETIIVTNSDRIANSGIVYSKILELASHNKVNGIVLDLKNVSSLSDPVTGLYAIWDADPTNVEKANAVADEIRNYIVSQVNATYTSAKFLVLVGGDNVIPFRRMFDGCAIYPETVYADQVDCFSPIGAAICQGYYLTDNTFGDLAYDSTNTGERFLAIPDLATGRLIENSDEIISTIETFIAQDGQIDISRALVSGYDFLQDGAAHIRNSYQQAGKNVDWLIGNGWNSSDLESLLFGSQAHQVHSLNDHSDHFSLGTPNGIITSSAINSHQGRPFEGNVFYSVGCHSGLNVPDNWAPEKHPLDIPQTMIKKGAEIFIGNTGFGWGFRNGVGYGEKLMEGITSKIVSGNLSVGEALSSAKLNYYLNNKRYDVFDEKTIFQSTLFGLPMYRLTGIQGIKEKSILTASGPDEQEADGIKLSKKMADASNNILPPPGVTEVYLRFDFSGEGVYQKIEQPGVGTYYTLNGEASDEAGDVVQPLFYYNSQLSGTVAKGVLFLGGTYTSEEGFNPLIGSPASLNPDLGEGPIGPTSMAFVPTVNVSKVTSRINAVPMTDLMRLTCYTGYYLTEGEKQIENLFMTMDFATYYSNSSDNVAPSITDPDPNPSNPNPEIYGLHTLDGVTANFSVEASDEYGIYRVVVVYTDYLGEWKNFDLVYNATSNKWVGSLRLNRSIAYHVQVVDKNGNLGYLTKSGYDLDPAMAQMGSTYNSPRVFKINLIDTDGDGMPDSYEDANGLDKNTPDSNLDPDNDGLTNIQEMQNGTNPLDNDTDDDGIKDGWEVFYGLNPLAKDSMLDPDHDGLTNLDEYLNGTNPYISDTDNDGTPDGWEVYYNLNPLLNDSNQDEDNDGLKNLNEFLAGTNPTRDDSDGDGDNDGSELHNGRNPLNSSDGKRITITVEKVGNDIVIHFENALGENSVIDGPYWVYRAQVPYHGHNDELPTIPQPLPDGTVTFTDIGAGAGTETYYYTVTNSRFLGEAPSVDVISPSSGPSQGGTLIKIYGEHFSEGAVVKVGLNSASNVVFVNSTTIRCETPAGAIGPADITVINPNGQFGKKINGFIYY